MIITQFASNRNVVLSVQTNQSSALITNGNKIASPFTIWNSNIVQMQVDRHPKTSKPGTGVTIENTQSHSMSFDHSLFKTSCKYKLACFYESLFVKCTLFLKERPK